MPARKGCVVVNVTSASFTTISVDPSTPTEGVALATGDYMLLSVVAGVTSSGIPSTPAGFVALGTAYVSGDSRRYGLFGKAREAGDSTYTVTVPTSNGGQAILEWYSGVNAALVAAGSGLLRSVSSTQTVVPGMTSGHDGSLMVAVGLEASTAAEGSSPTVSGPWTLDHYAPQTVSPQVMTTVFASHLQSTAGATGDVTITYPNASLRGWGVMVELPAAATGPSAEFGSVRTRRTVQVYDQSTGATGWDWDWGDGSAHDTTQDPSHTYAAGGSYSITLTASDGTSTDTATHTVAVPAPFEVAASRSLYDAMARYSDGLTPSGRVALTGQTWGVYSEPDSAVDGLWDSDDDTAAYLHADGTAEVVRVGCRFLWDTEGSTRTANTGTVAIGVTNDIANLATRKFRAHLVLTPTAVQLAKQTAPGGSLVSIGSRAVATTKDAYHTLELLLSGTTATVLVDGTQVAQWTDAGLAEDAAQHQVFFEPYYNNDPAAVRARFAEVWADWGGAPHYLLGDTVPDYLFVGDEQAHAVYLGDTLIW